MGCFVVLQKLQEQILFCHLSRRETVPEQVWAQGWMIMMTRAVRHQSRCTIKFFMGAKTRAWTNCSPCAVCTRPLLSWQLLPPTKVGLKLTRWNHWIGHLPCCAEYLHRQECCLGE